MQFIQLLCAKCDGETIYFDGDGMLYDKIPERSHYTPIGKFVYYEYYGKKISMLMPVTALIGAEQYDIEYDVKDKNEKQIKGEKQNGSK